MAKNVDAVSRQWQLLRCLPRYPRKITVKDIHTQLSADNVVVDERTIQRNLNSLSLLFQIEVDDREKPYGWSWSKDAKSFDLAGLTVNEALTWVLAEHHLKHLLPASAVEHLSHYFAAARNRLDAEPLPKRGRNWLNKVRTVPPMQPLIPPEIDEEIMSTVSTALLHEHQLEIQYRRKGEKQAKRYQLHPLALVQRGSVLYLYARLFDHPNARILALHRIEQASVLDDQPAVAPAGFDLDELVAAGSLDFGRGTQIAVKLRFHDGKGEHLHETRLSVDQTIEAGEPASGVLMVNATVADTPQLRWWLLGFGDGVEVLAPESLRHELSDTAARMAARYTHLAIGSPDACQTTSTE